MGRAVLTCAACVVSSDRASSRGRIELAGWSRGASSERAAGFIERTVMTACGYILVATLVALGACASSEVILENSTGARVQCPGPPGPQQQCVDNAERLGYR